MEFSEMDLDLFFESLTNFPGKLLLFMELLDLLIDFLKTEIDLVLDLFFEPEDIFFEELPLFRELLMATIRLDLLRDCNALWARWLSFILC